MDAINRVMKIAKDIVNKGGVAMAVSIDIANAFNSLLWGKIHAALVRHRIPEYIRRVVRDYLKDRAIVYNVRNYLPLIKRFIERGVSQGSVLGPLLWNLGYDPVLGAAVPDGAEVLTYADDTLIIIGGSSWTRTLRAMEAAVAAVIREIRKLGLTVATNKTEAIWFHNLPQNRKPPSKWLCVGRNRIRVGQNLKYLGITLDERLRFKTHLETLRVKITRNASYLGRILPNIIG